MKNRITALIILAAVCCSASIAPVAHAASDARIDPGQIIGSGQQPTRWTNTDSIFLNISFSSGASTFGGPIIGNPNVKKIEATFQLFKKNANGGRGQCSASVIRRFT